MGEHATRREFLEVAGTAVGAGMAGILATGHAPAFAQGTNLHWVRWNDFVPACDQLIRQTIVPEAEKALGVKIRFETIGPNDLQPRITAAIQSGTGADLHMLFNNHPHLYRASLADVSDVAEEVAKAQGGWYRLAAANCSSGGKFFAMPMALIAAMNAYRKSWFAEVGYSSFPKTWDEYRDAGKKLKAKGYPIGQSFGQSFGDPPTFVYPLLWAFGGAELDSKGAVSINSKETIEAVRWMTAAWKDSFDEGGLAWDDASNNRAFLAGTICSTLNGASIYIESLRKPDAYKQANGQPLKDDILHAPLPAGPKGQFGMHTFVSHVIPTYSKNVKATKDLLRFVMRSENYTRWFETGQGFYTPGTTSWESHPMWKKDPVMAPYAVAGKQGLTPGHPGEPNDKAAEVLTKYLIGNMFAAAIKGQKAEEAVAVCEAQLKKIYT
jgi:multiple sugar transport system substrate-binding protein